MLEESRVSGKCVGGERASKVTDCSFEKSDKVIRLYNRNHHSESTVNGIVADPGAKKRPKRHS